VGGRKKVHEGAKEINEWKKGDVECNIKLSPYTPRRHVVGADV
jgi:hypothetical protein